MEELVKIFGKYFPKEFEKYEIIEKEIYLENKTLNLDFDENKINVFKLTLSEKNEINLNLFKQKSYLIYLSINLLENANLDLKIRGKILNKSSLAIEIISNKNSRAKFIEKVIVGNEYVNITKIIIPKNAKNSNIELDQNYILFGNGKIINLPILDVNEKECKVKHSSKKIKLTDDQIFYLEAKSFNKEKIINLLEKSFFEV